MNERDLLRHLLATLAYRGGKCIREAPESFARFQGGGGKTPLAILAHMGDLLEWTLDMARGRKGWNTAVPQSWDQEAARFHRALEQLDQHLASGAAIQVEVSRLLQGPLADALTHVGQLAMLRRLDGAPLQGENYFAAEVTAGRLGPDQAPPRKPF